MDDDIAVVGIGCRFPGADNIDEYWRVLVNGENHVVDIPPERWNNEAFYSEDKDAPGKHYVNKAGFISNHDEFDNKVFQISDNEAMRIDPQQRYVLECTHMAMEDGGITRTDLSGTSTGVYIGVMNDDYKVLASTDHNDDTNYSATGMSSTIIASRLSFVYNLQGPCMVIDTACSSSMIAIHLGSQAIRSGDCEMAICGGVSSIISPDTFITLCKARMMSPTGQCQTFCDTADGYARGEGCGIVILKSYQQAIKDGNKIWGIVKTGSNQDGRVSQPITAPSGEQQEELLRKIYNHYNIDPTSLQYIETHGTGTPIGDPTEVNALGRFVSSFYKKDNIEDIDLNGVLVNDIISRSSIYDSTEDENIDADEVDTSSGIQTDVNIRASERKIIPIGSVKTNIGHTESAAGVAALIKVLLMMKNGKLVPNLHLKKDKSNLNKKIKLDEYGLDVALDVADWLTNENFDRICCVNSFGFGGSNSHAIVVQTAQMVQQSFSQKMYDEPSMHMVICVSTADSASLKNTMQLLSDDLSGGANIYDVSYTSAHHREHFPSRTLIYGKNKDEVLKHIDLKMQKVENMETVQAIRKIFVFCGVGTTWTGMCSELMETQPVFRESIASIDKHLQPLSGWRITDKFVDETTDYSDPFLNHIAIFCCQVGLFAIWKSWGIIPDVIVGQSVGEVAAAFASGALSLEHAVHVIYYRSNILADMTGGKMMVIGNYAVENIEELCKKYDYKVTIAVYNSPVSCTLSGDADVMEIIKAEVEAIAAENNSDIMIRPLSVQCAYHSHHVEGCMDVIEKQLESIHGESRSIDHISTVTGRIAEEDEFQTGKYWAENIRRPVLFMHALVEASSKDIKNVFVEVGPRQVLRAHLQHIMDNGLKGTCIPSMNAKKECTSLYESLNTLYEMGANIDFSDIVPDNGNVIASPRYGFNKSKFLYIPESSLQTLQGIPLNSDSHMYVRNNVGDKAEFRIMIDKDSTPFVYDHYFLNTILVPGATYVEAAFEVGQKKSDLNAYELSVSAEFSQPFTPPDEKQYQLDIEMEEDEDIDGHRYRVKRNETVLCHGTITPRIVNSRTSINIEPIRSRCKSYRDKEESYSCLERIDFSYGESLSLIEQSWSSETECLVEFVVPDEVKIQSKTTHLHPSIIDGMFQTFAILSTIGTEGPTLPKGLTSIVINRPPQRRMYGYSQMVKATPVGNHYNSMLLSEDGLVLAEVQNFYTKTLKISDAPNQSIVYEVVWNIIDQDEINTSDNQQDENDGQLVVFGSNRFINCFKSTDNRNMTTFELNESIEDTEAMYDVAFERTSNIRAVIFTPMYNIQSLHLDECSVYEAVKLTFVSLSTLLKKMKEKNYDVPLFIVTENVIAAPDHGITASNVCGGEIWGMVRSAVSETSYGDIRIVDMTLTNENATCLEHIIYGLSVNYSEYLIDSGNIYYSEVIEDPDQDVEPNQRDIDYSHSEDLILKSSDQAIVTNPYFRLQTKPETNRNDTFCKLKLQSIYLHHSELYPTSTVSEDSETSYWPEINDDGFPVVCLEGTGWLHEKTNYRRKDSRQTPTIGFCFPVNVATTVYLPPKCVYDTSCLDTYTPGMMTIGILFWNIVDLCKQSTNIMIIVDQKSSSWIHILKQMFKKLKKTVVEIETKDELLEASIEFGVSPQILVVLCMVTARDISLLCNRYSNLKKIVSTENFCPRHIQRWASHNLTGCMMNVLRTEELFTYDELTEKVPKVFSWFKALNNKNDESTITIEDNEVGAEDTSSMLTLPFQELSLLQEKNSENYIPLKVYRAEVFRKNGCYLIVGGLTGLGWEILQMLGEHGAGYIATLSRRPPSIEKQKDIEDIQRRYGCKIIVLQVDITNMDDLKNTLRRLLSNIDEAQIKGVFHGGGAINDVLLSKMTLDDIEKPLQPKVLGTWNLHVATISFPLDFFVMHSSIVAIFGNAGQCNYAAGNSFQDSFAHYRRSLGLCGQSINWSTLSLGMAAEDKEVEKNFRSQGFYYLSVEDIKACFFRAIMTNPVQVAFGIFDWAILEYHPVIKAYPYKFSSLTEKYGKTKASFKRTETKYHFDIEEYNKLDATEKRKVLIDLLKKMIADSFVVDENNLNDEVRFVELGIDSMAAMGFANSVFETIQVRIPVVTLLSDSTSIGSLAEYISENIQTGAVGLKAIESGTEDNKKLYEYLRGSVTFMQANVLNIYTNSTSSQSLIHQADYEVVGLKLKPKDWRFILNHLIRMNPELRRIYTLKKEDGSYGSKLRHPDEIEVDMEQVPFDSICCGDDIDDRADVYFDLTKDLPIRFKIACKKSTTRMRIYMHSIVSDLSGLAMLFRDIGSYMKPYVCKEALPEKDISIVPADSVRKALTARLPDLRRYWKLQFSQDIQPFTFGDNIEDTVDEAYWYQITEDMPIEIIERLMAYMKSEGLSLYNFLLSIYMVLLHDMTNMDLIPVITNVDMRGHVPQLKSLLTRCINTLPVVGDLRNLKTVAEYIKRSSVSLNRMTQQSAYPFELLKEEMTSDELRKHVDRHKFAMVNMSYFNQSFKHKRVTINVSNIHHTRLLHETAMYVEYDLDRKKVSLQYTYNAKCVKHEDACLIPGKMLELLVTFMDHPDAQIGDILAGNVSINADVILRKTKLSNGKQVDQEGKSKVQQNKRVKEDTKRAPKQLISPNQLKNKPQNGQGRNIIIIREDSFTKQTSQGWDHSVEISLALDTSVNSTGELVIQWGRVNSSYKKRLPVEEIRHVSIKDVNGVFHILIRTSKRWFVMKTLSSTQAKDWLHSLRRAVEENMLLDKNQYETIRL